MKKPAKKAVKAALRKKVKPLSAAVRAKRKAPKQALKSVAVSPKAPVKRPKTTPSVPKEPTAVIKPAPSPKKAEVVTAKIVPSTPKAQIVAAPPVPRIPKSQAAVEKSIPPVPKANPQTLYIPQILLETVPPPLVPRIPESRVVDAESLFQEEDASIKKHQVPRAEQTPIAEVVPLIPTMDRTWDPPVHMEPAAVPRVSEGLPNAPESQAQLSEPGVVPGIPTMELREPERGILRLLARDPHCLFAIWDFPNGSLELNRLRSMDGGLHLRIGVEGHGDGEERDVALTPEACEWFIPVDCAGTEYRVEMGYRNRAGAWVAIADAALATTPAEAPAAPAAAQMHTVVFPVFESPSSEGLSPQLAAGSPEQGVGLAADETTVTADVPWIPEVQAALATLNAPVQRAKTMGMANSLQWVEWLESGGPKHAIPGPAPTQGPNAAPGMAGMPQPGELPSSLPGVFSLPASFIPGQPSQPEAVPGRKFWFTVNAELVIYGATEPDAQVEIGGNPIRLRPDGGFSFRFSLPDGRYELPVVAVSADGVECRGAVMQFARCTQTDGEVGAHPQNPELKKPVPESCV